MSTRKPFKIVLKLFQEFSRRFLQNIGYFSRISFGSFFIRFLGNPMSIFFFANENFIRIFFQKFLSGFIMRFPQKVIREFLQDLFREMTPRLLPGVAYEILKWIFWIFFSSSSYRTSSINSHGNPFKFLLENHFENHPEVLVEVPTIIPSRDAIIYLQKSYILLRISQVRSMLSKAVYGRLPFLVP